MRPLLSGSVAVQMEVVAVLTRELGPTAGARRQVHVISSHTRKVETRGR